jgi:hypothetical protein
VLGRSVAGDDIGGVSVSEIILKGFRGKRSYQVNKSINMDFCNVFVILRNVRYSLMRMEEVPSPFYKVCSLPIGYVFYNTKKTTRIGLVPTPSESCKIIIEEKE